MATEVGCTRKPKTACIFLSSRYPDIAIQAAKNVICPIYIKIIASPEYLQKICTERKGLAIPIKKDIILVSDVIVIETVASDIALPNRIGTDICEGVRLHAASITKVSFIPIPVKLNGLL